MIQIDFNEELARKITDGDPSGKIVTRDGFPVRILVWDAKGFFPVVGLVDLGNSQYCKQWTKEGKSDLRGYVKTNTDLVITKEGGPE